MTPMTLLSVALMLSLAAPASRGRASCPEDPGIASAAKAIGRVRALAEARPLLRVLERNPRVAVCYLVNGLEVVAPGRLSLERGSAEAWRAVWSIRALRYLTGGLQFCAGTASALGDDVGDELLGSDGPGKIPFFRVWPSRDIIFIAPRDTQERIAQQWRRWFSANGATYQFRSAEVLDEWYF